MKIIFINRPDFELVVGSILGNVNIRSDSAGSLDIGYADKILGFSDKYHAERAIKRIKEQGFKEGEDFSVDKEDQIF